MKCKAKTRSGRPCRAYAVRGTEFCSAHSGKNKGKGAKKGNKNAEKHGFYRSALDPAEIADLLNHSTNDSIEDELAIVRVMLRRLLQYLQKPIPKHDLALVEEMIGKKVLIFLDEGTKLAAVAPLIYRGARTVSYMLKNVDGKQSAEDIIDDVLDEMGDSLGVDL